MKRWFEGEKMLPFELSDANVADADGDDVALEDCEAGEADDLIAADEDEALALEEAGADEGKSVLLIGAASGVGTLEDATGRFLSGTAAADVVAAAGRGMLAL